MGSHDSPEKRQLIIIIFKVMYLGLCWDLCRCTWTFSTCGEQGPLFLVELRLLLEVAPLVAERGLQRVGARQLWRGHLLPCSMWNLLCPLHWQVILNQL